MIYKLFVVVIALFIGFTFMRHYDNTNVETSLVSIVVKDGVNENVKSDVEKYVAKTLKYYSKKHHLNLESKLQLVIVKNTIEFQNALINDFNYNPVTARYFTSYVAGLFLPEKNAIIIDSRYLYSEKIGCFIVAHEMTHAFEYQLGKKEREFNIYWLEEGSADYYASKISQVDEDLRKSGLIDNSGQISLERLEKYENFVGGENAKVNYAIADQAAVLLANKYGEEVLLRYYTTLGKQNFAPIAFYETFGIQLPEAEKWISAAITNSKP